MKFPLLAVLILMLNLACAQHASKPITQLTADEMASVLLLDVRTPQEFDAGHLEGAVNMDWLSGNFDAMVAPLDKIQTIYVYCKMGGRSAKAQARLKELGFTKVVNLEGGYDAAKK